ILEQRNIEHRLNGGARIPILGVFGDTDDLDISAGLCNAHCEALPDRILIRKIVANECVVYDCNAARSRRVFFRDGTAQQDSRSDGVEVTGAYTVPPYTGVLTGCGNVALHGDARRPLRAEGTV